MHEKIGWFRSRAVAVLFGCVGLGALTACQDSLPPHLSGLVIGDLVVSPIDQKKYKALTLDNGLRVIIIEDPTTDRSAAAMAVSVGSYDEPFERAGIAHFLEHMLFLGTEKYPKPDGFMHFIAAHGGNNNAYTSSDHTNYFFEIGTDGLPEALDRFARFFIDPLFDAAYVDKERNAVEGEYQLQIKDDLWRIDSVQRKAFNPNHPASQFNIGNLETLADRDTAIRDDLLQFYARHYHASRMALVVLGPQSLAQLGSWVHQSFGAISATPSAAAAVDEHLFTPDRLPAVLGVKPEKELYSLFFDFQTPPLQPHYLSKPMQYIARLVGDEGPGSLHSWLKKRGWIESLSAAGDTLWRQDSFFSVQMKLTEDGRTHWQDIGAALFAYIRKIKAVGPEAWRFDQHGQIAALAFDYQPDIRPMGYVRRLAAAAMEYPLTDVVRAPYVMNSFAPEVIRDYLALLTPQRVLVTRVDPDITTDAVEHRFNVPYQIKPLPAATRTRWQQAPLPPTMLLPRSNAFIPKDLSLINIARPLRLPSHLPADNISAWHMPDVSFGIPNSNLYFRLSNKQSASSLKEHVLKALYIALVKDSLNEYAYAASEAGLAYDIGQSADDIVLSVQGFSDHQAVFLTRVVRSLARLKIDPERMRHYQKELSRTWRNTLKDKPYRRNMAVLNEAVLLPAWHPEALADAVEALAPQEVEAWAAAWFAEPEVAALLHGNIDQKQAQALARAVTESLPGSRASTAPSSLQLVNLHGAKNIVHKEEVEHADAALVLYIQGQDQSVQERAQFALLSQMLRSDYFNYLRTEKQFGYVVAARSRTWVHVPGMVFIVQSPSASAWEMLTATQEFVQNYSRRIKLMTDKEFVTYKHAVINQILKVDTNPTERAARLWEALQRGEVSVDYRALLARKILALSQASMRLFHARFAANLGTRSFISYSPGQLQFDIEVDPELNQAFSDLQDLKDKVEGRFSFSTATPETP